MREERLNSAWLDYGVWLLYVAFASPFLFFFATWGFVGQLIAVGIAYSLTEQLWYRYQRRKQLKRQAYQRWLEEREDWDWFFNEGQYILQGLEPPSQSQQPVPVEPEPAPRKKWSQFVREVLGELSDGRLTVLVIVLTIFGAALLTDRQFMAEVKTEWYRWIGEAAVEETVHPRELSAELTTDPHQYPVDSRFSIIP